MTKKDFIEEVKETLEEEKKPMTRVENRMIVSLAG